ncbi:hypothetical protein [Fusibacter sp. 3D3]|uniref:hypothetical protein n=1 Tax=Fusibacter sp. 3D3 TaxID=1048380 RepID=UPI000853BEE0|nr:hypothetical protein [Fusibacter sp. 3D3]GAU78501.1 hypothetical protein F3D3_3135 [Fusibacter sp. 3D3]
MKDKHYNTFTMIGLIALICLSTYLSYKVVHLNRESRALYDTVHELAYRVEALSEQIDQLEKKDQRVQNANYNVTTVEKAETILGSIQFTAKLNKITENQKITLLYRPSSSSEWLKQPIVVNEGHLESKFELPYTDDYELQIMFEQEGETFYETLPNLDLHTKLDHMFSRHINMHKVTGNKMEFDAQIVLFQSDFGVKLDSALCHIYYKDQLQKTYDVIQETEAGTQKEPQLQMEHQDADFWFINKSYAFENINDFNPENIRIELLLTDTFGNTYLTNFE